MKNKRDRKISTKILQILPFSEHSAISGSLMITEEFGPTMECIKGPKNIVADTLSHIKITSDMESLDMTDWEKILFRNNNILFRNNPKSSNLS